MTRACIYLVMAMSLGSCTFPEKYDQTESEIVLDEKQKAIEAMTDEEFLQYAQEQDEEFRKKISNLDAQGLSSESEMEPGPAGDTAVKNTSTPSDSNHALSVFPSLKSKSGAANETSSSMSTAEELDEADQEPKDRLYQLRKKSKEWEKEVEY